VAILLGCTDKWKAKNWTIEGEAKDCYKFWNRLETMDRLANSLENVLSSNQSYKSLLRQLINVLYNKPVLVYESGK